MDKSGLIAASALITESFHLCFWPFNSIKYSTEETNFKKSTLAVLWGSLDTKEETFWRDEELRDSEFIHTNGTWDGAEEEAMLLIKSKRFTLCKVARAYQAELNIVRLLLVKSVWESKSENKKLGFSRELNIRLFHGPMPRFKAGIFAILFRVKVSNISTAVWPQLPMMPLLQPHKIQHTVVFSATRSHKMVHICVE